MYRCDSILAKAGVVFLSDCGHFLSVQTGFGDVHTTSYASYGAYSFTSQPAEVHLKFLHHRLREATDLVQVRTCDYRAPSRTGLKRCDVSYLFTMSPAPPGVNRHLNGLSSDESVDCPTLVGPLAYDFVIHNW